MSAAFQQTRLFRSALSADGRTKPRGALSTILTLRRNPLEIWGRAHFERPFSIGRSILGLRAAAHDPAAVRHVFLDNAANYRKDDLQLEGPEPGPRQRPADGRGRRVAPPAPVAGAAVFAAPGRRIRSRHAARRRSRRRADRPPPRRSGDGRRRTDVAHDARSAGADPVLAGARPRAERIPARGDELFQQLRTPGSARSPRRPGVPAAARPAPGPRRL